MVVGQLGSMNEHEIRALPSTHGVRVHKADEALYPSMVVAQRLAAGLAPALLRSLQGCVMVPSPSCRFDVFTS